MAEFNPYRAWLSLESDAPNHYELLGLAPSESRAETISTAAANIRRKICSIKPQPEEIADWSRLLSELESVESVLTDPTTRAQYNRLHGIAAPEVPMAVPISSPPPPIPAPAPHQMPTSTTWAGQQPPYTSDPSASAPSAPVGSPVGTPVPYSYGYAPVPAAHANPGLPDPMAPVGQPMGTAVKPPVAPAGDAPKVGRAARASRKHRQRKNAERNLPVYLAIGAVGMAVLAGVVIALNQGAGTQVAQQSTSGSSDSQSSEAAGRAVKASTSSTASKEGASNRPPKRKAPVADAAVASPMNATEGKKPAQPQVDDGIGGAPEMSEANTPPAGTAPEPASETEPATPEPTLPKPATPEPTLPEPATPEPEVTATPVQIAALNKQMTAARDFLTTAQFDKADQIISEASTAPGTSEQRSQLRRLMTVADLTRQFHAGLQQALSQLKALSEIDIGSVKIAVVEVSPDKLVIRANGQNRSYSPQELPWALGLALTTDILPNSAPENKVVKAMYLAVHHQRTASLVERAESLLAEAIAAGADAEMLTAFLDDRYVSDDSEPEASAAAPEQPAKPPTPDDVERMSETLVKIEADFAKNNIAAARKRLEALDSAPGAPAQLIKRQQLAKVADRLDAFHSALTKATDGLKVDEEIAITSSISAKVVEVTQDKLRIELTGGTPRVLERNAFPAALAVEVAKRELGDTPEAKVASALFVFFHPAATNKYKEQAQQWLEDAGQDADLLPIFEAFQADS